MVELYQDPCVLIQAIGATPGEFFYLSSVVNPGGLVAISKSTPSYKHSVPTLITIPYFVFGG